MRDRGIASWLRIPFVLNLGLSTYMEIDADTTIFVLDRGKIIAAGRAWVYQGVHSAAVTFVTLRAAYLTGPTPARSNSSAFTRLYSGGSVRYNAVSHGE